MSEVDADGKAMIDIALSHLEKYSEQEKDEIFARMILYLWALGMGIEPSPENAAKYLSGEALEILEAVETDLRDMKRAQEESS